MKKILATLTLCLGLIVTLFSPVRANTELPVTYDYFYSLKKALTSKNYVGLKINKNIAKIVRDTVVVSAAKNDNAVFEMHFGPEIGKNITDYEFLVTIKPTAGKQISGYVGFGDNAAMMNKKKATGEFTVLISFDLKDGTVMASFKEITNTQSINTSYADFYGDPVLKFFIAPDSAGYTIEDVIIRQLIRSPFEM